MGPALATAFRTVDEKVLRAARQDGKDYGSTATVALCFAAHRSLFVAHVGDSRSVLSRCPPSTPLKGFLHWGAPLAVRGACGRFAQRAVQVPALHGTHGFCSWGPLMAPGGCLHFVVERDQYH